MNRPQRGTDLVSLWKGDVDLESVIRALNQIGYEGPPSGEWEDAGMSRDRGAPEALRPRLL
jgi:sugar phosphate isomerase/epimerase